MIQRHHRKRRSQGGTDDPDNILLVTPEFHGWIHDHPKESYENGWMVESWQRPSEVPITPHEQVCPLPVYFEEAAELREARKATKGKGS